MEKNLIITNGPVVGLQAALVPHQEVVVQADAQSALEGTQAAPGAELVKRPSGALLPVVNAGPRVLRPDGSTVEGTLEYNAWRPVGTTPASTAPNALNTELRAAGMPVRLDPDGMRPHIPEQRSVDTIPATPDEAQRFTRKYIERLREERSIPQTGIWRRFVTRLDHSQNGPDVFFADRAKDEITATWEFSTEHRVEGVRHVPATRTTVLAQTAMSGLLSRSERSKATSIWGDTAEVLNAAEDGKKAKVKSASLFGVEGAPVRNWRRARRYEFDTAAVSDRVGNMVLQSSGVQIEAEVRIADVESDSQMPKTILHAVVGRPDRTPKSSVFNTLKPKEVLDGAMKIMAQAGFKGSRPQRIPTGALDRFLDVVHHGEYDQSQKDRTVSPQYAALEAAMQFMPSQTTPEAHN